MCRLLLSSQMGQKQPKPLIPPRLISRGRMPHEVLVNSSKAAVVSLFEEVDCVGFLISLPPLRGLKAELLKDEVKHSPVVLGSESGCNTHDDVDSLARLHAMSLQGASRAQTPLAIGMDAAVALHVPFAERENHSLVWSRR